MTSAAQALRLFAELLELDRQTRQRRIPQTLPQKQRRAVIARELHRWALAAQQPPSGGEQRKHPRTSIHMRVQMLGGPRPVDLETESLAVGGASVKVPFSPRVGDTIALRMVPPAPDTPFEVNAEVVWFDPLRLRAGVEFEDLNDDSRALLERLVFEHLLKMQK